MFAWFASRPISRAVVAPLTRLRERIAVLDVDAISKADLGADEHIIEVDALRHTLGQLIVRVDRSLSEAHRFAANAAHELRTPLTSVRAELELLVEGMTEERGLEGAREGRGVEGAREGALAAQQKLADLAVLVERLLILSVPARSMVDAHEIVSLRDLLEDVVEALPRSDAARVALSDEDALVRGDAALLHTMTSNAIANGLKFGHRVTTELTLQGDEAILHVEDDGPGIDPQERERVFEPFFRSPDALRRRLPGHGLGLALIRHVAQTHGGQASFAERTPGQGTRLVIRLKLHRAVP
jgi:two-component system sensor histidine kinase TctE